MDIPSSGRTAPHHKSLIRIFPTFALSIFFAMTVGCSSSTTPSDSTPASPSTGGTPTSYSLAVSAYGSGTVTSSPQGVIDCGTTCSATFSSSTPTSVTLSATPATGYTFSGWGGNCSGTGTCVVTMSASRTVYATFSQASSNYTLSVSSVGSGTVTSNVGGINCGSTCAATIAANTAVTLSAVPATGYFFNGWTGSGCSGTSSCVVEMTTTRSVVATFLPSSGGLTFYVDPSSGNDAYDGLSLAQPFRTIGHAVSVVNAGDTIEVRGGTYTENVMIRRPGNSSGWITMRAYNNEQPVIQRTGAGPTLWFYHSDCDESVVGNDSGNTDCRPLYWVLQGLTIRGSASDGGSGDGNAVKIDTPKVKLVGNKICCANADVVKVVRTANDAEILGNEIWQDSSIVTPGGNAQGVDIVGADRVHVAGNYVHDINDIGIYAKGNSRDPLFENNRLVNIGIHALMLGQSTDSYRLVDGYYETYDGIARNNVVVGSGWSCVASASSQNVHIYNNSCYNTGQSVHGSILLSNESEVGQAGTNIEIRNNIIYGSANNPVIKVGSSALTDATTLHIDHNIYYVTGSSPSPRFTWDDAGLYAVTFATWQTTFSSRTGHTDASSVNNPLYSDISTASITPLTLQPVSPAINTGVNTTYVTTDFVGVARPQSGTTDIGAYEY